MIVSNQFLFIVNKNKCNFAIKRRMWHTIWFYFTEEQIKQRKQYEKAERQREMEICRQLVRYIFIPFYILWIYWNECNFSDQSYYFCNVLEPIRRIAMGTSRAWRGILEGKCSDGTKVLWQNGKKDNLENEGMKVELD